MERMPFTEEKKIFEKVATVSDLHRLSPEQRAEYDMALKRYRDYNLTINTAIEEGLAQGLEKGLAKGRAEGRAEGLIEVAKKMLRNGMDATTITNITGLSVEEIENLK